ncbi:hypothetical protein HDU77_010069, partial [Chytriomyces hyalinus]
MGKHNALTDTQKAVVNARLEQVQGTKLSKEALNALREELGLLDDVSLKNYINNGKKRRGPGAAADPQSHNSASIIQHENAGIFSAAPASNPNWHWQVLPQQHGTDASNVSLLNASSMYYAPSLPFVTAAQDHTVFNAQGAKLQNRQLETKLPMFDILPAFSKNQSIDMDRKRMFFEEDATNLSRKRYTFG